MKPASDLVILGDWGTSVCRLYLCRFHQQELTVVARTQGPGIKHINDPEARFFGLCKAWFEQYGSVPVFLIGTVGADIGRAPTSRACQKAASKDLQPLLATASKSCQTHLREYG